MIQLGGERSCLHCVLGHLIEAVRPRFARRDLDLIWRASEPTWLPYTGQLAYRRVWWLLHEVCDLAQPGPVRLALHGILPERSHVEVVASFRAGRGWRARSCALPRYREEYLWLGVPEGLLGAVATGTSARHVQAAFAFQAPSGRRAETK